MNIMGGEFFCGWQWCLSSVTDDVMKNDFGTSVGTSNYENEYYYL